MLTQVARVSRHAIAIARAGAPHLEPAEILHLCGGCSRSTSARVRSVSLISLPLRLPPRPHHHNHHHGRQSHHHCCIRQDKRPSSVRPFSISARLNPRYLISEGRTTSPPDKEPEEPASLRASPFYLETGYSIFAKRPSRPFPPPFVSLPSGSFSDPLTTHNVSRGRRPYVNGEPVRGITNGDDAIIIADKTFLAVNDGVGAWALKDRGHAALWSRLIAHFWAREVMKTFENADSKGEDVDLADLNPIQNLEVAYNETKAALKGGLLKPQQDGDQRDNQNQTADESKSQESISARTSKEKEKEKEKEKSDANDILGTTTASSALLHYRRPSSGSASSKSPTPVILATTLGDCKVLVIRPSSNTVLYHSTEQWHWFDCPRQLGTNSPDTPLGNAVTDTVDIQVGDVVLVLSDGVTDNLWEHEICHTVSASMQKWQAGDDDAKDGPVYVARTLMNAAREIAQDPNAESPYMERAFDEGIAAEGGKLDDISVVLGVCRARNLNQEM
ncbi:hypothetical protein A1O1_02515 [Capronia coronata CBS 617.96]|uniref:Protein phosphatase n=1 Tax=Capronia coronata CBS 617.96 TaxID=1182541 RepID=W9YMG7_9EURO|nr:uncharacterized protein A1O1_02515 [Capronia coronata CBS 617.96]EXJ94122.1 hypothetical protein A1O1_02515 [Capronia coronata CBS 617.96]